MWLPPSVSRDLAAETAQQKADVAHAAIRDASMDFWNRELKQLDERLELIKAREDASVAGLTPGFWHVMRHNPDGPPSLLPLTGDHGEFVEPTSRMLDLLRSGDLQNERAMRARREFDERAAAQRKRDKENAAADRRADLAERIGSMNNVSVRVPA